jgi:Phage ABA sandwich domain
MKKPGGEIDALVAEKVLELVPCDAWEEINLGSAGGSVMLKTCDQHDRCYPRNHPAAFSTIMAAAWKVVEHLGKKDWDVAIRQIVNGETHYEVEIDRHTGNPTDKVVADAPTAPLAICTAALRASDYQEELPQ